MGQVPGEGPSQVQDAHAGWEQQEEHGAPATAHALAAETGTAGAERRGGGSPSQEKGACGEAAQMGLLWLRRTNPPLRWGQAGVGDGEMLSPWDIDAGASIPGRQLGGGRTSGDLAHPTLLMWDVEERWWGATRQLQTEADLALLRTASCGLGSSDDAKEVTGGSPLPSLVVRVVTHQHPTKIEAFPGTPLLGFAFHLVMPHPCPQPTLPPLRNNGTTLQLPMINTWKFIR